MNIRYRKLQLGQECDLDCPMDVDTSAPLTLAVGADSGATASSKQGITLWLPIRGRLALICHDALVTVDPGEMLVWTDGPVRVHPSTVERWLVLAGSNQAWRARLERCRHCNERPDPVLYPSDALAPVALRKALLSLAIVCRRVGPTAATDALVESAITTLWDVQRRFDVLVARCNGHTYARRCQNLHRLLRVRNRIRLAPFNRVPLDELAREESYSPWHLVRAFHAVFGESPVQYGRRLRLSRGRAPLELQALSRA